MNKTIVYTTFFFLLVWSVFALQFFNENPTIFTTMLLLVLEIISFSIVLLNVRAILKNKLNVAVFIWTIYVIINTLIYSDDLFVDMRDVLWWPLIYFLFYCIAIHDIQDKYIKSLIRFIPILFILLFLEFLFIRSTNAFTYTESGLILFKASNGIYFNALLLPFAFLLKNKRSKYLFLLFGLVIVLVSFKRAALIFTVAVIIMSMYYDFIASKNTNIFYGIILSCFVITVGLFTFNFIDKKTDGFITQRIELMKEDNGSGRTEIYKNVLKIFKTKNIEYKVLGSGFNSFKNDNKIRFNNGDVESISTHNDILEIIYDFGIIGLVIYFSIIGLLVKRIFYLKKIDDKFFQANLAAFIIFTTMTMVSHLILYPTYFVYLAIIWAITEGLINKKQVYDSY